MSQTIEMSRPTVLKSKLPKYVLKHVMTDYPRIHISSASHVVEHMYQLYEDDINVVESFYLLLLNKSNNTIGYARIAVGGISECTVDPVIIAKYAIESLAQGVILVHNHPSGNNQPSNADKTITKLIMNGLKLFRITLLDHVIITPDKNNYYSFANEGTLI